MTIEDPNVVDFLSLISDEVVLTVSDHLDWQDELAHLADLQEKVNRYLAFVESGEMVDRSPEAAGRAVRIDIAFKHPPPDHARQHFLEPAAATIHHAGMRLTWRVV